MLMLHRRSTHIDIQMLTPEGLKVRALEAKANAAALGTAYHGVLTRAIAQKSLASSV
jgi:hypothetical protein